jgi:hypothetical protein
MCSPQHPPFSELLARSPKRPFFPHSSSVITVLGWIVIRDRQLTPGGSLGEPAQLDDAGPDPDVARQRKGSASNGIAIGERWIWLWPGHWRNVRILRLNCLLNLP